MVKGLPSRRPQTLQTVERALDVLEAIGSRDEPLNPRALAVQLGLNISTTYHLINTLLSRGYIRKDKSGFLELGAAFSQRYARFLESTPFHASIHTILTVLSEEVGETVWYSELAGDHIVVRGLVEGPRALKVGGLYLGLTGNEHRRASGRVILPHLQEEERRIILDLALEALDPTEREAVLSDFEIQSAEVLTRGWSIDNESSDEGIVSIGAPVFSTSGRIIGAVGVVGPQLRMTRQIEQHAQAAMAAAKEIGSLARH